MMAADGHTFGQRQPPLYVTIQKILDKYPDGQIFKEIIQNADDAGASTVHFYLDNRQHGTHSVILNDLNKFQGPSLLAYNDAVFTDKDWQSIQDMQQSVKAEDPFKVGKFGIGFNSVYHITDLPTILSGNRLAYLDPHEEIWPKETGQWYDIDKNIRNSDTFAPFENLCGFSTHAGKFAGTLFRFPLRNVRREKGVSSHLYNVGKLRELLMALREEAKCILLFLRSVRTVNVFEIAQNGRHSNLLKVSIRETANDQLGPKRLRFQQNLEKLFEAQSYSITAKLNEVVHVQVEVNDLQDNTMSSQSKWLVANQVGSQSEEVRKVAKVLKVFPWVGAALETSLAEFERGGGRVFCVLPMPLEVRCNLPVHVNGTFSLNDERRQLKWQGVERKNDQSAQWNDLLVKELLPPCYASLLLDHAKMLLQPDRFYKAWPNTSIVRGTHWEGLLTPLLNVLFSQPVISFRKPGGLGIPLWIKVSSATFVPRGTVLPTQVTAALVACGVKLVTVTDAIWNALTHCGIIVTSVSPSLTRAELKKLPRSYSSFSSYEKLELLRYCLSDNTYGDLYNLALLPLANGNFTTFQNQFSASVYLCSKQCPRYFLPNLDGELVDNDIEKQLYVKLKDIAERGQTNLKVLTVSDVATLLPRAMPQEWQYQTTVTLPYATFTINWFERFWRWVAGGNLNLFSNQLVVPVFDSRAGMQAVTRLSQTSPSLFITSTTNCSQYLIAGLEKLGVKCCMQRRYPYVQHVSYLSSLMNYYSPNGIVDAITCASPSYSSISLTKEEANELRTCVEGVAVTYGRQDTLRNLPMFMTLGNTGENLHSVTQVERSTNRSAQMEPLSFPLNAKNIPSTVILFSSSDYYQKALLQSLSVYCTTTVDLLRTILFPLIEDGFMGRNSAKQLMKEVLEKFDVINSNTTYQKKEDFKSSIARLPFLPVSVGKPKAPNTLFSPSDSELKNLYYQEPVFPVEPFSSGRCLTVLRSCELKTRASAQEVVDIISSISSPANAYPVPVEQVRQTRAKAVLTYISRWESQLSETVYIAGSSGQRSVRSIRFSDALKELSQNKSWLPVQSYPPHNYPTCLNWKGSGSNCHLVSFGSSVVLSQNQDPLALACGSQMYFIEHSFSPTICSVFTPSPAEIVKHAMAHLEEVIPNYVEFPTFEEVRRITRIIYQLLHKYQRQGYTVYLSMLQKTEDCVWISKQKRFVHPYAVALKQNASFRQNLEPFIYTLPDDLDEFTSLFEALGVQKSVTETQILGILKKIKDGSSESLGVSNDQAWQLVMSILNWLTGSGEHRIDKDSDCESLYVPVEPDTEWPTLVRGEDVVYTDSAFLQRFLESSNNEEDNYTFVNHRVSSQLAHQLRLTPLSKYLNISEDAFEDVGQNEPLTVRLKNILKNYKDGLTIIKELLQNADDAGASEMNICYDTRYHGVKRESMFFPGMAECHGPALVVNNNAMFTKEDFKNITKLAGATKVGQVLKIGKFGVGFCSVYHITDIPSFISDDLLYIFDPTLTYLKDEVRNPALPGKKVSFTSNFISRSKQLAPYVGLFGFDPQSRYEGTMFRFPFRTTASELSGKIYTADDVKQLREQIQKCSSKLLVFLQNIKSITISQIDQGQESSQKLMSITKTTQTLGSRCIHEVTCSVSGSPNTSEYWLVETSTETILEKYSTASVACSLCPLPESGEQCYRAQLVEGEMFCFLPLSVKTGLPVHVSSNFAVSNNRMGIWTSDDSSERSEEVQWNESLMEGVISSAYCELLEALKEMQTDSRLEEYEFFSMWPLEVELRLHNPWHLSVTTLYESIETKELFFSVSTEQWLTLEESRFLDSAILKVSYSTSIPSAVLDIVNHLQLPVVHLPEKYSEHLDLSSSIETEEAFLEHFFSNIDELDSIVESRNTVLCLALECYANELDQKYEDRFCYLQEFLKENACIPCEPGGKLLRKPDQLIHPQAYFAKLFDEDENVFPLKAFCNKKLVEKAMIELGILYNSIPLQHLEERATGIADLYELDPTRAMERAKLITECLLNEDKHQKFTSETCTTIAETAFLPVLPKPKDYPLPWKGDNEKLCTGKDVLLKGVFHVKEDSTNLNIAGSQVVFLNQELPSNGGCGLMDQRVQEILRVRSTPSYAEVISHFQLLIKTFDSSPEMVKWADRISRKVYEFLDKLLKPADYFHESEVAETIDISPLTDIACVWTGEMFVKCDIVAQTWRLKGPYLYKVPDSMATRRHLQEVLEIKENFLIKDFVSTLQCLKRDSGVMPLPDNCITLVREILPALPSQKLDEDYGPVMLPDDDFVMHEATDLYFNDMPWAPPDKDYTFVHKIVPLATAKALGVQLCRKASLAKYSVPGSQFKAFQFGQHEELTRRIQNIIRDYPFDMTILKELLQNADDAKATKMHVILDMRTHSEEHLLSEGWQDLQGPALLVWNDSVFSKEDLKGIQSLGLGSKRSDSETIGQYGIGFNAVYHLTDCPSFLTGGDTLCVLDPHMRYVYKASDRYPGVMLGNLDDKFWNNFDGIKTTYLRDGLANRPNELLGGSLFRFPLRHTPKLARLSEIAKDLPDDQVISSQRMKSLLEVWAPKMKQSLLFLNNVIELKFFVIEDGRGVLKLQNSYKTELDELALKSRSDLVQKIKAFTDIKTREPCITTYPLTIVESLMVRGKDQKEEWLIQQGIGDIDKKVETWSYVEQVKPRHGIAAPLKRDKVSLSGQVFCFLPLPLHSELPVHINGHFILNSTRRNLWTSTDPDRDDDKSCWNKNILRAIASSYAHFLERITEYYAHAEGFTDRATLERDAGDYYLSFPRCNYLKKSIPELAPLSEPWLQLARQVFQIMAEHNSPILAVPTKASLRSSKDKHFMQWQPLINEQLPESQVHFWKSTGEDKKLRPILERVGMKITCAPLWIMNHLKEAKCEIPVISRSSVYDFYMAFNTRFICDHFPQNIEDTPFKSVEDFKTFTAFLLEPQPASVPYVLVFGSSSAQSIFPKEPFDYPLLLTADNQLRIFEKANKVLCSKYANLFPQCPDRFLHKDLLELSYSLSYFVSASDNETVRVTVVKELLESVLPEELKNMYVSHGSEAIKEVDMKSLWKCFSNDEVFKSVLSEVLKVWALLLTKDGRFFRCGSSEQLLPIIALKAEKSYSTVAFSSDDVAASVAIEQMLNTPFLDTEVVPIGTVSSLCPKFSDPKGILKNLYYLHREFPFTETITVDNVDKLLRYLAKIHLKEEPQCWPTLKCLPLFETINGTFTPLQGKRVYVWPGRICQEGNDNWLRGTDLVFLKPRAAWSRFGVASELGICRISAEETYVQFIFPNFFKLKKEQRYRHLKHIRDYLFETNFVNQKIFLPATQFVSGVTNLQCIGDDGKPLQTVSSFCTHKKMIFTTFPERFKILPEDILQREEQSWMDFFHKLGLQNKVTEQDYLILCNDVADGKLREKTRTASRILLKYLFSEDEAKLHGFHNRPKFLQKVSDIAFVCPVSLPGLEWIHKVPQTPNRVILANEDVPLCKLSGSCLAKAKDLVWTVIPIVPVSEYEEEIVLESLGIHIQPIVQDVIKNITHLSRSCFADAGLFMKYTAPQWKTGQRSLMEVFISIFIFLQSAQSQSQMKLQMISCIPVFALGQFNTVLVEPYRVVCRNKEETKPYYPFIHSVPDRLYVAKELLNALGVEDSLQLRHMQIVLESAFKSSDGMKLEPNSLEVVKFALKELNSLLVNNENNKLQKMGQEAIAEQLNPLYLPGVDGQMHHVDSLVHSRMRDVDLHGTNLHLLWTPRTLDVYAEKFCALLPEVLRPKPLSKLCIRKVSQPVEESEHTECAMQIERVLQIPALSQGMCTVVRHVTNKSGSSSEREAATDNFEKHLHNFLETLRICCVKHLTVDVILSKGDLCKTIATESLKCYVEKKQSSYCLYLDSSVVLMDVGDIRECIVEELVAGLKNTYLDEIDYLKIRKFLEYLLRANSSHDVYDFLQRKEIHCAELDHTIDLDILDPKLGDHIPRSWHFRLDPNNNNIFQPQEWVGYEISDGEYIFAQVLHPVNLIDSTGQPLKPMQIKYKIFTSDGDEEAREVKAIDLFKFTMGKEPPQPANPNPATECKEVVPFVGAPDDISAQNIPLNLQQAKDEIRQELRDIWQLPVSDRKKAIRRLYLKWHPDKNLDNVKVAEEAFKFLLDELDRLENSDNPLSSDGWSWRTHQKSWNNHAYEQKCYSQQYSSQNTYGTASSSHQQRRGGGVGGGGGGGGGFFGGNFTPPTDEHEGKRWVRQAMVDSEALEALLNDAQQNVKLSSHVCFLAHEVTEKALKGGMYAACGLGQNSLKNHDIESLACSLEFVRPQVATGLAKLTLPLVPYYLKTRFPNQCNPPDIPSDKFTLSDAENAAKCARGILNIVRNIVNNI